MSDQYFYKTLGLEFGPLSLASIQELLKQGTLGTGDQVREVNGPWREVASLNIAIQERRFQSPVTSLASSKIVEPTRPEARLPEFKTAPGRAEAAAPVTARRVQDPVAIPQSHSTTPPISSRSPEKDIGWNYRTNEGIVGPIDTEKFLLAVHNGVVGPKTLVRLADHNQWMAAEEIAGLEFPLISSTDPDDESPKPVSMAPHPSSNIEMRRLFLECLDAKQPKSAPVRPQSSRRSLNVLFTSAFNSILSSVADTVRSSFEWSFPFLQRMFRSRLVWALMIVIFLAILLPPLVPKILAYFRTRQQIHQLLSEAFAEVRDFPQSETETQAWAEIQTRTRAELEALLPRLTREAKSSDMPSMSMLWIARDYLPSLLNNKQGDTTKIEEKIATHLELASSTGPEKPLSSESWDLATTLMIFFDVLVACTALTYWTRKLWSRTFVTR